jgi:hypothetical protein
MTYIKTNNVGSMDTEHRIGRIVIENDGAFYSGTLFCSCDDSHECCLATAKEPESVMTMLVYGHAGHVEAEGHRLGYD